MITINATGDTTLHTAGKYCPEDILVKVPAGGSGGASVDTCTVVVSHSLGSALGGTPSEILYTSYIDGSVTANTQYMTGLYSTRTLTNVICGSGIAVNMPLYNSAISTEGCIQLNTTSKNFRIFSAPNEKDATGTISFSL